MSMDGRVAMVTGASRRGQVGEAVARGLLRRGAKVALVARSAEGLRQVAEGLAAEGGTVSTHAADLSQEQAVRGVVGEVVGRHGSVDILVHAAGGLTQLGPLAGQTLSGLEAEWRNNVATTFLLLREILPRMRKERRPRVVVFASAAVNDPRPGMSAYLSAKSAVVVLARVAAREYAAAGVGVTILAPTILDTAQNRREMGSEKSSGWVSLDDLVGAVIEATDPDRKVESGSLVILGR